MWTEPWHIPCTGVKLGFKHFCLVSRDGRPALWLQRTEKLKRKLYQKHLIETGSLDFFRKIEKADFEIVVGRDGSGEPVNLTEAHAFTFLLMIKNGGRLHAPAVLSASIFDDPETDIFCDEFIAATPITTANTKLSISDAKWIQKHLPTALVFIEKETRFQNAMQALTSFHCIPYANFCLLTAWTGLEALFQIEQELSFRLCLYISNYLRRGQMRQTEFNKLRTSYVARSKIAHGLSTKTKDVLEFSFYTRDILRMCLRQSLENGELPQTDLLVFS